jgi:UDPglucose--hexose-1-phosphate uridylyltransferase
MNGALTLRFDATTDEWIAFAPRRSQRPHEHTAQRHPSEAPSSTFACPFCPGNEQLTLSEVLRMDGADARWRVRVVPNLYPAFTQSTEPYPREGTNALFREMGAYGAHEVVVESQSHLEDLRHLPAEQVQQLLWALRSRAEALSRDPRLLAIVVFKNKGPRAGTSLRHPHWQIMATPVVPALLERKARVARAHFESTGHCLYTDLREAEETSRLRLVEAAPGYVAFAPYASPLSHQVRILPLTRRSSFAHVPFEELEPLSRLLPEVLRRLDAALGEPDFNVAITSAPTADADAPYFSWHLDVFPRIQADAGFELGSGMHINTALPESVAAALRND